MRNLVKQFFADEAGATAIEYGLIAALISIAMVGTVITLGEKVTGLYKRVAEAVPADVPVPPSEGG